MAVHYIIFLYYSNSKQRNTVTFNRGRNNEVEVPNSNRLSWPQFYQRNRIAVNNKKSEEDQRHREPSGKFDRVLCPDEARVMQKANQIVMYVLNYFMKLVVVVGMLYQIKELGDFKLRGFVVYLCS